MTILLTIRFVPFFLILWIVSKYPRIVLVDQGMLN